MIAYGYCKGYEYTGDGTLTVRTRIPSIHGPYRQTEAQGKTVRNYVRDEDLPWYPSILLPHLPQEGEVVVLSSYNDSANATFIIIGLTGGSYTSGQTNLGG